ncbi:hypothetical protein CERSUDRAFT_77584 [Gelatoporia subvermispora B]|uniref:Uncharacterized protein n=1 Tax=Ceriporiopsis subvermispora (strain B) TaxID=914234 RepID=M2P9Y5_CERS8|nr:hypothetical protein CERSUDRAFT_77584 [Gelatoporia subvermispora B]
MTEYTTSSEAVREYMASRERTLHWVQQHSSFGTVNGFASPSTPPSIITDSDAPSYGPSDSDDESSHSQPPRMVLRYNDGRPDIPISHDGLGPSGTAPPSRHRLHPAGLQGYPAQYPTSHHSRSQSGAHALPIPDPQARFQSRHGQSLSYATSHHTITPQPVIPPSRSPESIVVLPSRQTDESEPLAPPPTSTHHTSPQSQSSRLAPSGPRPLPSQPSFHTSSPRNRGSIDLQRPHPPPQFQPNIAAPTPRHASNSAHTTHLASPSPPITHSHSQPIPPQVGGARYYGGSYHPPSSRVQSLPYQYQPPAIVYAPSSKHSKMHYAPPAIVYSPSTHHPHARVEAPSITFSHSVPVPPPAGAGYYPQAGPTAQPPSHPRGASNHEAAVAVHHGSMDGSHSRSPDRGRSLSRNTNNSLGRTTMSDLVIIDHAPTSSRSPSRTGSDCDSQTSGSTYYVLPSPGQKVQIIVPNSSSLYTASSTTKSAHSPLSQRKPFFQRIFSIPKGAGSADSRGSGGQGKRLARRHTLGGAHLRAGRPLDPDR